MKIALTRSNFFAATFFGCLMLAVSAYLAGQAATGALAWSSLPALLMLAVMVTGLLAIIFNFVWMVILEVRGQKPEETAGYWPVAPIRHRVSLAFTAAAMAGVSTGFIVA